MVRLHDELAQGAAAVSVNLQEGKAITDQHTETTVRKWAVSLFVGFIYGPVKI